ncbi:MAG: DinB family protein [Thermomicrobiales bacterium]
MCAPTSVSTGEGGSDGAAACAQPGQGAADALRKTPALLDFALAGLDEAAARPRAARRRGGLVDPLHRLPPARLRAGRRRAHRGDAGGGDDPTLPSMDNEALAREGEYVDQSLFAVREDLRARRAALIARLAALDAAQWQRPGHHPQQGAATVLDVAINAGLHDVDHLEQIAHCRAGGQGE